MLDQRSWWFINDGYDKAALATEPTEWARLARAHRRPASTPIPDLRLIHLHRMDYTLCLERHRTRAAQALGEAGRRARAGPSTTASSRTKSSLAGSAGQLLRGIEIRPERIRESMARAVLKRLRAVRDRLGSPRRRRASEQWQRVVLDRAVEDRLRALDPARQDRGGDQRRRTARTTRGGASRA
jgi:hypothetical protein